MQMKQQNVSERQEEHSTQEKKNMRKSAKKKQQDDSQEQELGRTRKLKVSNNLTTAEEITTFWTGTKARIRYGYKRPTSSGSWPCSV